MDWETLKTALRFGYMPEEFFAYIVSIFLTLLFLACCCLIIKHDMKKNEKKDKKKE